MSLSKVAIKALFFVFSLVRAYICVVLMSVDTVKQGERFSFKIADKIRPSDKLFKLIPTEELKAAKKRKEQ